MHVKVKSRGRGGGAPTAGHHDLTIVFRGLLDYVYCAKQVAGGSIMGVGLLPLRHTLSRLRCAEGDAYQ